MNKQSWPPGNMLYPVPAVLVSLRDKEGRDNLITVAWAGTVCSDPAMLSISVRKERYSHHILKETGEFVVNLSTSKIIRAVDLCGVKSGRDTDKFKLTGLTKGEAVKINCPTVEESPVNIECKVRQVLELGTHDMFIAEVLNVQVDESLLNERGALKLEKADLIAYSHGDYFTLGKKVGSFGYSVRKPSKGKKPRSGRPGRRKS